MKLKRILSGILLFGVGLTVVPGMLLHSQAESRYQKTMTALYEGTSVLDTSVGENSAWQQDALPINNGEMASELIVQEKNLFPAGAAATVKTLAGALIDADKNLDSYATPGMIDDNSSLVQYAGNWGLYAGSADNFAGTTHYLNSADAVESASITLPFIGTGVEIYTFNNKDRGMMEVFIDGVSVGIADNYAAVVTRTVKTFEKTDLPYGYHTLILKPAGQKNAAASSYKIELDAIKILDSDAVTEKGILCPVGFAQVSGDATVITGDVAYVNFGNGVSNGSVTYTVTAKKPGNYYLGLLYNLGSSTVRKLNISVNGGAAQPVTFLRNSNNWESATGATDIVWSYQIISATLEQGQNTVTFALNGTNVAPMISDLTAWYAASWKTEKDEPTVSSTLGSYKVASASGFDGYGFDVGSNGSVTWNVSVPADAYYELTFAYSSGSEDADRPITVLANGEKIETLTRGKTGTGIGNAWKLLTTHKFALKEGENSLTLQCPGGSLLGGIRLELVEECLGFESTDIYVDYTDIVPSGVVYSVDIIWEDNDMTFDFGGADKGLWNPSDHSYSDEKVAEWIDGDLAVSVINHSNVSVKATLKITDENPADNLTVASNNSTAYLLSAEGTIVANAPQEEFVLTISGTPTASADNVATATITLSPCITMTWGDYMPPLPAASEISVPSGQGVVEMKEIDGVNYLHATAAGRTYVSVDGKPIELVVEKAKINLVLVSGQSNAAGIYGKPGETLAPDRGDGFWWTGSGMMDLKTYTDNIKSTSVGWYPALAYEWHKLTGEKTLIVSKCYPGRPISTWADYNTGTVTSFTADTVNLVENCVASLQSNPNVELVRTGYYWLQGENDAYQAVASNVYPTANQYKTAYLGMHAAFKQALTVEGLAEPYGAMFSCRTHYEIVKFNAIEYCSMRAAQQYMANTYDDLYMASVIADGWTAGKIIFTSESGYKITTDGAAAGANNIHYNQVGYNILGLNAADNMYEALVFDPDPEVTDFEVIGHDGRTKYEDGSVINVDDNLRFIGANNASVDTGKAQIAVRVLPVSASGAQVTMKVTDTSGTERAGVIDPYGHITVSEITEELTLTVTAGTVTKTFTLTGNGVAGN